MNLQNKINVKKSNQLGTMLRDLMSHLLLEIELVVFVVLDWSII